MKLLALILQPKNLIEYCLLVLLIVATLFFIPAVIIHRKKVIDSIKNRKWVIYAIVLLFFVGLVLRIDTNVIKVYNFAKEYSWQIDDIYHEKNQLVLASDSYFEPSVEFSKSLGLPTDQIINEPIEIYRCSIKGDWSINYDDEEINPRVYLIVGIHKKLVVYGVLSVDGVGGYRYYPVDSSVKKLKQEFVKSYVANQKGLYNIPFSDEVIQ